MRIKDFLKPAGKIKIDRIFINKKTGQMSITLPKRKIKHLPKKVELTWW